MKTQAEFQEPDRKKKIKRIIEREELIFLGIFVISFVLFYGGHTFNKKIYIKYFDEKVSLNERFLALDAFNKEFEVKPKFYNRELLPQPLTSQEETMLDRGYNVYPSHYIKVVGAYLFVFVYPLYLLIRFIIWAIKALKEK
ncbi:hypothetical protein ACFL1K_00910 [Candidatus Omnitrophota bacterium]